MIPPRDVVTRQPTDIVAVDTQEARFSEVFSKADELRRLSLRLEARM